MKKHLKNVTALTIVAFTVFCQNSCNKESETPVQSCKTCIARDKQEGVPVDNERICSDEAESAFRNTYSDYAVTCE